MSMLDRLLKRDRRFWFVCYSCMMQTGHDTVKSVYYSEDPPVFVVGKAWSQCPRCGGTNTKSFQSLKDEGSNSALFGLEQVVKKYPREQFEVKAPAGKA